MEFVRKNSKFLNILIFEFIFLIYLYSIRQILVAGLKFPCR